MVNIAHASGKPILLDSCGQLTEVMDDVIDDLGFDAKHSYEDVIEPVEEIYERLGDRIAVLGGIDLGFHCKASRDEITHRSRAMLERSRGRGGYALGSGNSIPDCVTHDAYFAMTRAALEGQEVRRNPTRCSISYRDPTWNAYHHPRAYTPIS